MIETVYSEINKEDECVKIPKNIHQIGSGETKCHIYIEDKVAEFLALLPENEKDIRYGVLLGTVKFFKGERYLFINGMVEVRDILENTILFGDDIWTGIYEDIKKYYRGQKIIGWYASLEEVRERDFFQLRKIHLDHFAGNDKVFLNIDRVEGEKEFYVYNNGDLEKIKCYHIYYEKNPDVERYVCETHYDFMCRRPEAKVKSDGIKVPVQEVTETEADMEEETSEESELYQGIIRFSNKAVAVFVLGAFLFTFGTMYKQGQFRGLTDQLKTVVAGIMDKNSQSDLDGILLLDETSAGEQAESQTAQENTTSAEETTAADTVVQETTAVQDTVTEETTAAETATVQGTAGEQTEPATQEQTSAASIVPATTQYYTVEQGDTLYKICMDLYGNTNNIEVIMQLNNLESADSIYSGKTLIVP